MATQPSAEYLPSPWHQGARNRTGDQVDRQFVCDMLAILGDCRLLWLPSLTDTTTSTGKSRFAATVTYSESLASFDTRPVRLGSGVAVAFNGTDEEGDTPDNDRYSFGDGAADEPFSVVALVNPTDATNSVISSKWDESGGNQAEWLFYLNASDYPQISLHDSSANADIGRSDATALTQGSWALLVATYDGSAASTGIRVYKDAARVDDTDNNSGTYTAVENEGAVPALGYSLNSGGTKINFFDGSMALAALAAKELGQDEVWAVKELVNAHFGLSL